MLTIRRCTGADADFRALVRVLDEELDERYGAQMAFFGPHNRSDDVQNAVVLSFDDLPAGCGCFKSFSEHAVEIKRIYVHRSFRGRKFARAIMTELEVWAREMGFSFAVLETGVLQPEAIRLYEAAGYARIPNYPPYVDVKESVCFQKTL